MDSCESSDSASCTCVNLSLNWSYCCTLLLTSRLMTSNWIKSSRIEHSMTPTAHNGRVHDFAVAVHAVASATLRRPETTPCVCSPCCSWITAEGKAQTGRTRPHSTPGIVNSANVSATGITSSTRGRRSECLARSSGAGLGNSAGQCRHFESLSNRCRSVSSACRSSGEDFLLETACITMDFTEPSNARCTRSLSNCC